MLLWVHSGPTWDKWSMWRAKNATVLTRIVICGRIIIYTFHTVCSQGAISPTVPKHLRAVDQDAIGCAEIVMWVTIVITTETT